MSKRLGEPLSSDETTREFDIAAVTPTYEVYEDDERVTEPISDVVWGMDNRSSPVLEQVQYWAAVH